MMDDGVVDDRERRVIKNEALFRQVNDRIEDLSRDLFATELSEFICECGEASCQEPIQLSRSEYEAVRADATHFVIVPGHDHPDFETVVTETERFAVIEKVGEAEEVAERTDPRG